MDFYASCKDATRYHTPYVRYPQIRIPIPNRFLLVGGSGSGKTNVLRNILHDINAWSRYYLFVKRPDEALYADLIDKLRAVEEKTGQTVLTVSSDLADLPDLDELDQRYPTCVVFDDVILEGEALQARIGEYYVRGRKCNVTCFYLAQRYFALSTTIRSNSDVHVFKRLKRRDLAKVMDEFAGELTRDELLALYDSSGAAHDRTKWFLVDTSDDQPAALRYRHNWVPVGPSESD